MIGNLLVIFAVVVGIQGLHLEDDYDGPFLDNGCPKNFSVHWLLPHETECNKFYYCVFGDLVERTCAPGTYFNPDVRPGPVCDWPWNVDCDGRGTTVAPPTGSTPSPTPDECTTPAPCPPPPVCPPPTPDPTDPCIDKCLMPWPHETDCDKFWRCEGSESVKVTCSEGLHFNAETGMCDFICNANCERASLHAKAHWEGLKIYITWDKVDEKLRNNRQIKHVV